MRTIPGDSLKALYKAHGNRLFDQNVRLFLGTRKGSVNAGIRDTLKDPGERGYFWAYNNGITIVATSFDQAHASSQSSTSVFSGQVSALGPSRYSRCPIR